MEKRESEFQLLRSQALGILTDETKPDETHTALVINISCSTTFRDYTSWIVFTDAREAVYVLRKTVWQRTFDVQRFRDPLAGLKYGWSTEPSISVALTELPAPKTAALLANARSVRIRSELPIDRSIVLDGTRWSVFAARAFRNQSYTWNVEPRGWEPVITWTAQAVAFLESVVEGNRL